ncbi:MAG: NAD-dependent epimerase/dehydratase family protein [Polyangiaceae bacterium]|jgi:nucleoside-diphosphate-sugar epimerase|nr:NAD-dependent epimerase/dehydratase family protein [Polyangiaceae bacterium]
MKVLVTGGAGRLGSVVCKELLRIGHDVLATDQRFLAGLSVPQRLADLCDAHAVYPLLEGCEAVVHLGNIPNLSLGPSPQVVLSRNAAMNTNVFRAAVDLGVRRIVFASSIQAMIRLEEGRSADTPPRIPYFPLDGEAPADPGNNFYGLSKEFGERTLRVLSERFPELVCTALRFPLLVGAWFYERAALPLPTSALNFSEALTYLDFSDAARLVGLVLDRQGPGYHQYFPAQAINLEGYTAGRVLSEFFPHIPRRLPPEQIETLVDRSALEQDFGFRPAPPLTVRVAQR